jgi:molecular chaperone DnaK (HSP70)
MSTSRASTQTLGREDTVQYRNPPQDDSGPERINLDVLDEIYQGPPPKRLIIGIDFGTTYSAVSYVDIPEGCSSESIDPLAIKTIQGYPDGSSFNSNDQMLMEVPTEVIYPLDRHFRDNSILDHMEPEAGSESDPDVQQDALDPTPGINVEDRGLRDEDEDGDISMLTDPSSRFRWGYEVHDLWSIPATHCDSTNKPLSRFKLLLDDSQRTQRIRDDLNETLVNLKRKGVINKPLHVIADFLTHLLAHTQSELQKKGFDNSYRREIVLSVPAIWKEKACRDMQSCLAEAMQRANFQNVDIQNNSIENLFIVSEPEAAAAYMLGASRRIKVFQLAT